MSEHNLDECTNCLMDVKNSKQCKVYTNRNNVMLDDENRCYSRVYSQKKYDEIKRSLHEGEGAIL